MRALGKRAIGNFAAFDLLVALMLGELVDEIIYGHVSFLTGTVAILVISGAQAGNSWGRRSHRRDERVGRATMELDRLAVRCVVSYLLLLVLLRGAGKRGLPQASPFDFVLALCVGDLVDDVVWVEVPISPFVVAAVVLLAADLVLSTPRRYSAGGGPAVPPATGTSLAP